jgi:formylglycine-generating enzyme required for sulfatase activity
MFIIRRKNQSKASRAHATTLLILIVLIASCAPRVPITGTSMPAAQPESKVPFATPTLGTTRTQVSDKDGMVMVLVPADSFEMGGEFGLPNSFPAHSVYLDDFWLDQTEVTNEMFAKFVESTSYVTDAENAGSALDFRTANQTVIWEKVEGLAWNHPDGKNSNISGLEDHPVVHVSWNDANKYCAWAGRRLPTEAEWEKAASWNYVMGEKYKYPWGNDFDQSLANFCDVNCTYDFATKYLNDGYVATAPVGSFPDGASPYGVLDMSGNVLEWVADWYAEDYYEHSPASNPLGPDSGQQRVARGGAWASSHDFLSTSRRWEGEPSDGHRAQGFRCALGASS